MKTERAIELLKRISDSQFDGEHGDERREALSMAVRALSGDGDTISRQQAIDAVVSAMIDGADAELVEGVMELLPSAQPERKTGRWNMIQGNIVVCSECGMGAPQVMTGCLMNRHLEPNRTNFCPNCGADMGGESE